MKYKLGSLFDGSGGFPLAGTMCGIEPVWASEVEPYPIAVTRERFPGMKHLGDITKVNGAEVEPVDLITFGSPCQDLSVAGKRAGLKHEDNGDEETTRSGLFMEAVRIIREMRSATHGRYPTYALWENVPGAFSSNKGEDFRIVLEELIKIVEPKAVMPAVPKNGWSYSDSYCGNGWSLAYRVLDAQWWGVPQRRKRIYLVFDLRGQRAGEVLFEREGLRGYFAKGRTPWQGTAPDAEGGTGADDREGNRIVNCLPFDTTQVTSPQNGCNPQWGDPCHPLAAHGHPPTVIAIDKESWSSGAGFDRTPGIEEGGPCATLQAKGPHAVCVPVVFDARGNGDGKTVPTLTGDHENRVTDYTAVAVEPVYCLQGNVVDRDVKQNGAGVSEGPMYSLNTVDRHAVAYAMQGFGDYKVSDVASGLKARDYKDATDQVCGVDCRNGRTNGDLCGTLQAKPNVGFSYNCIHPVIIKTPARYIVRRLTPTECARLQGFPDTWGHIEQKDGMTHEEYLFWLEVRRTHDAINGRAEKGYTEKQMLTWYNKLWTDSSEYKMWGNGIALPTALYVMQGIREALDRYDAEGDGEEPLEPSEEAVAETEEVVTEDAEDVTEAVCVAEEAKDEPVKRIVIRLSPRHKSRIERRKRRLGR